MRAALVVHRPLPDPRVNLAAILSATHEAASAGAHLVLFPEAALTGLVNDDNPIHDLPLGETIPGMATDALAQAAEAGHIWLAIGLLEREGRKLYDSTVLIAPTGKMVLKYRRIQPQWHGRNADSTVYCQGTELTCAQTP
jgi:N-carbamoylputrescine amidase